MPKYTLVARSFAADLIGDDEGQLTEQPRGVGDGLPKAIETIHQMVSFPILMPNDPPRRTLRRVDVVLKPHYFAAAKYKIEVGFAPEVNGGTWIVKR